jgi:hypothetical protein
MLPLFPPDYPDRPDAPLLSMGPSFSEEIARSLVCAIWHENAERPHESDVRMAAGLTMLEAFHPRDQLETMLAAQGVAAHCAIMDDCRWASDPETPPLLALKFRSNAASMSRMFCTTLHELLHLQSRPLPPRPGQNPISPTGDGGDPPEGAPLARPRAKRARAKTSPAKPANPTVDGGKSHPVGPPAEPLVPLDDLPAIPEDIETRPDGTPGNLTCYIAKPLVVPYVPPREAPIMVALATRPKPWRMVNVPKDRDPNEAVPDTNPPAVALPEPERQVLRGPLDMRERIFTGDALATFAATRLDPSVPLEPSVFYSDVASVELELISTGGDPSAEAELAAMKAAHPEGKPIVTFHYGGNPPSDPPLADERGPSGPAPDGPVPDGPVPDAPVSDGPVPDAPVPDAPVSDGPLANGPHSEGPLADRPLAIGPFATGPFATGKDDSPADG